MADGSSKPNVLICGGVNTYSRALAAFLVPLEGEPLVSHLRIVDKYSVAPATTYLGAEFPKVLAKPEVDYKQANLTVPCASTQRLPLNALLTSRYQPLYNLSSTHLKGKALTIMFLT
ncbi:hypothetical protein F5890DRAFT_1181157 [Lentinula detonsa]|uniref:Uncharacterized protein n=1 Tax=Lentinula detonsa TaxID=2804962 RepID=A0AA38Q0K7_9AGAR|nr:hypothetical protein F5890DRAFT_1181157 [Lentinula detonsa]